MTPVQRKPFAPVASAWSSLAQEARPNPFLSHHWHRALHELAGEDAALEVAVLGSPERPEAMATLGSTRLLRGRVFRPRALLLNETGSATMDRLTVEHNAVLASSGHEGRALARLVTGLASDPTWDEICVGWVDERHWADWWPAIEPSGVVSVVRDRCPYHFRDLGPAEGDPERLLAGLGRNTRSQIRRALRAYGGPEGTRLQLAADSGEAGAWFDAMVRLHQARWQAIGKPGAFADAFMRDFHKRLIELGTMEGYTRMLRLEADGEPVAYLYNLRVGDYECNYQSGLISEQDNKRKPGMVAHVLAMARAASDGVRRYDLLMGDSQYKRSLANGEGCMIRVTLQRRRVGLWLERQLRRLRGRLTAEIKPVDSLWPPG